ncbi:DUF2267 domain-containing protein [Dactylosporangium sp. NPDC000555]|uniref:DUF2267 domain-containing protein n=1 Tax=Dactylosporangium sp. NPDC000555 TaxID=3154260 RepID=UPI00332BEA23
MNEERFRAVVRREAAGDPATVTRTVLETLAERLMPGLVHALRDRLPAGIARELITGVSHETFGADEFVRRVAVRAGVDREAAERYARAVFTALSRALEPADLAVALAELPRDYRPLTEGATRSARELGEFVRRVADRAGATPERARRASEAAMETLAERISGGEVDDLIRELPLELRPVLERGRARSGGRGRRMNLEEFLRLVAERADAGPDEARDLTRAVLVTVHDAVTDKEFGDLLAQLPSEYAELAHA